MVSRTKVNTTVRSCAVNKLLFLLSARLPCRLIKKNGRPYLERYFLFQLLGWTFYLHRLVDGDGEDELHNHEWETGFSLVFSGFYVEDRVIDLCPHAGKFGCITKPVVCRWFNRVDGNTFHRVTSAAKGTWTLFFHSARVTVAGKPKGWGFLRSVDGETVFKPWPHPFREWWHDAQTGQEIGRVPL